MAHRAGLAIILLLMLAAPLATGQARRDDWTNAVEDPAAAMAPVTTVVGQADDVVRLAIEEAERDGTPDQASAIVAQLLDFAQGLGEPPTSWPPGSAAAQSPPSYRLAVDTATLLDGVPADIAIVERDRASCDAYGGTNATRGDRDAWLNRVPPAVSRLSAVAEGLAQAANEPVPYVDTTPLARASGELNGWLNETPPLFTLCVGEVEERLSLPPRTITYLDLRVRPTTTWPTGTILVSGGVSPIPTQGTVRLRAPAIDLDTAATVTPGGGFLHLHELPQDANLGTHNVTLQAGGRTTAAPVIVDRAPTSLALSYRGTIEPGQTPTITVRLIAPAALIDDADGVTLTVPDGATPPIANGTTTLRLEPTDEPTTLRANVRFEGTPFLRPSTATYTIQVVEPPPPAGARADFLTPAIQAGPLIIGTAILLLAGLAFVAATRWRRRRLDALPEELAGAAEEAEGPEALDLARRSIIEGFARLAEDLERHGTAKPGTTAREIGGRLRAYGATPRHAVEVFEYVRYGGHEEPSRAQVAGAKWTSAVWRRVRYGRRRPRR